MNKHTPGPWRVDGCFVKAAEGSIWIGAADSTEMPYRRGEAEANARLIAAAPDLLEAVRYAHAFGTQMLAIFDNPNFTARHGDADRCRRHIERMEKVMDQAEGK